MPIQFYCPQGHLLQAPETQMGLQGQCPYCGTMFIVPGAQPAPAMNPAPQAGNPYGANIPGYLPAGFSVGPAAYQPTGQVPAEGPAQLTAAAPAGPQFPHIQTHGHREPAPTFVAPGPPAGVADEANGTASAAQTDTASAPPEPPQPEPEPVKEELLHIPCPKGHVLETPLDMLDQEVLCPHCQTQFLLSYRQSREYQEKQAAKQQQFANRALKGAIATAVLVGASLIGMMIYSMVAGNKREQEHPPVVDPAPAGSGASQPNTPAADGTQASPAPQETAPPNDGTEGDTPDNAGP